MDSSNTLSTSQPRPHNAVYNTPAGHNLVQPCVELFSLLLHDGVHLLALLHAGLPKLTASQQPGQQMLLMLAEWIESRCMEFS